MILFERNTFEDFSKLLINSDEVNIFALKVKSDRNE